MNRESRSRRATPPTLFGAWRRKWFLAAWFAAGLTVGVGWLVLVKPEYEVSARLLVERTGFPLDENRPEDRHRDFLPTQTEIIASPAVMERALEQLRLPPRPVTEKPLVVEYLDRLKVDPVVGANVLSIRFRHPSDVQASQAVEAIIASYREFLRTAERDDQRETIELLTRHDQELRDELETLQRNLVAMRERSRLPGQGPEAAEVKRTLLKDLSQTLATVRSQRLELDSQMAWLASITETDSPDHVWSSNLVRAQFVSEAGDQGDVAPPLDSSDTVAQSQRLFALLQSLAKNGRLGVEDPTPLQQALLDAQLKEADLSQQYLTKHPEAVAVRKQIAGLEERLRLSVEALPDALTRELAALRVREQQLSTWYEQELEQLKEFDVNLLEQQTLIDKIERTRQSHDTVLAGLRNRQPVTGSDQGEPVSVKVRVLESPAVTSRPLKAPPSLLLSLCSGLGLLGGLITLPLTTQRSSGADAWR